MSHGKLKIATCQFAVSSSIRRNSTSVQKYMLEAHRSKADILHMPECALSGYVGTDFPNFSHFDWGLLKTETEKITALAKKLKLWVLLGSVHQLAEPNKPYNSLYLISPQGRISDRYDKRFCTRADLRRHTAGKRFVTFDINGVKCSLLICFDVRFPELYRELYKQGVKCIFQSFYNARQKGSSVHTHIMCQSMQCRAATNYIWVSMSNASGYYSPYASCFIQPDGVIANSLRQNKAGIMINAVDLSLRLYDASAEYRDLAIAGKLDNGDGQADDKTRPFF